MVGAVDGKVGYHSCIKTKSTARRSRFHECPLVETATSGAAIQIAIAGVARGCTTFATLIQSIEQRVSFINAPQKKALTENLLVVAQDDNRWGWLEHEISKAGSGPSCSGFLLRRGGFDLCMQP